METVPWVRFRQGVRIKSEMEELWKRLDGANLSGGGWAPPVDISETDNQVFVVVELPGVDVGDIDIRVTGDTITVKGEKRRADLTEDRPYFCKEIYSGRFHRSFRLPTAAGEKVAAHLKNGILTMVIPKATNSDRRRIRVTIAG